MQCVLRHRRLLPRNVYVSEDLPEEWIDCRKMLRPIYNAAKRNDQLKHKTHLSQDKLIINGKSFTVAPVNNVTEANDILDLPLTCQRVSPDKDIVLFMGAYSPYSNLYHSEFTIDNTRYTSVEQYIQSEKASLFDDDVTKSRIMKEVNPYKTKKYGSKVRNFVPECWRQVDKQVAFKAVCAKFQQNVTLRNLLIASGNAEIAESTPDEYWGTGVHIHNRNALDKRFWKNNGGVMCELLSKVHSELIM